MRKGRQRRIKGASEENEKMKSVGATFSHKTTGIVRENWLLESTGKQKYLFREIEGGERG